MNTFNTIDKFQSDMKFGEDILDRYDRIYEDMYVADTGKKMGVVAAYLKEGPQFQRSVEILFNAISPGSDNLEIEWLLARGAGCNRQRQFWKQLSDGRYDLLSHYRAG